MYMRLVHKKQILIVLAFCLSLLNLNAQFARFRHITVEEGLTQNYVNCFAQDKKGFIWIGTNDGLNKYDGKKITNFKANIEDSTSITHGSIRCLYIDNNDILWAGTGGGGMFNIDLRTLKVTNYFPDSTKSNTISNGYVNAIIENEPGKLFIATFRGLNVLDKKTGIFTLYNKEGKNKVPFLSDNIRYMTADKEGHLWCSHPNKGITEYNPKTGEYEYYTENSTLKLPSNSPKTIFCDSKGKIWVSYWVSGTAIIDKKNKKVYLPNDSISHPYKDLKQATLVSQYFEDSKKNIWFATAEHGVGKFDALDFKCSLFESNKDDAESINDNTTFSIYEDRSGLIWCGTWKGGANILDPRALNFGYYKHENNKLNSLNDNSVFSVKPKSASEVYIGTNAGVSIFNTKSKTFFTLPCDEKKDNFLRHNTIVTGIYPDDDGSIWIGSFGAGLYRYYPNKNSYSRYMPGEDTNSYLHHSASHFLKDKLGRLWISSSLGLVIYNSEKNNFTRVQTAGKPGGLSSNYITNMISATDGKFWIGTLANGLNLFDPETRISKRVFGDKIKNLPPDLGITSLLLDSKNVLWVGTAIGLFSVEPGTLKVNSFTKLHSSLAYQITSVEEDNTGFIWVTTSQGICKLNPSTKEVTLFGTSHGIQGKQFTPDASCALPNGYLIFGGLNGFNAFNASDISLNTTPPNLVLTAFTALNKPYKLPQDVSFTDEITLSYKNYFFEFDFAALDFTDPSKNQYAYKLEGFNENWVNIGNEQKVTFTNLDPKEYTLLIKASNNDGFWGEPIKIKLTITPPFWRTTWFYILCIVAAGLLIYTYIKRREKKLLKEKALLEQKVEERTAELQIEKLKVEEAHKDIKDSINYAKRIQQAQMPTEKYIEKKLKDLKK
jgi:ligand-binding sensor domain-containing protein